MDKSQHAILWGEHKRVAQTQHSRSCLDLWVACFGGADTQTWRKSGVRRTHNVPHTAPLGVVIEYVVLGRAAVGGAWQGKGRGWFVIPLDSPLHHLLLYPLHLKGTNADRKWAQDEEASNKTSSSRSTYLLELKGTQYKWGASSLIEENPLTSLTWWTHTQRTKTANISRERMCVINCCTQTTRERI